MPHAPGAQIQQVPRKSVASALGLEETSEPEDEVDVRIRSEPAFSSAVGFELLLLARGSIAVRKNAHVAEILRKRQMDGHADYSSGSSSEDEDTAPRRGYLQTAKRNNRRRNKVRAGDVDLDDEEEEDDEDPCGIISKRKKRTFFRSKPNRLLRLDVINGINGGASAIASANGNGVDAEMGNAATTAADTHGIGPGNGEGKRYSLNASGGALIASGGASSGVLEWTGPGTGVSRAGSPMSVA